MEHGERSPAHHASRLIRRATPPEPIRSRRIALGPTSEAFTAALNIGIEQVQAQEDGATWMSMARMQAAADVLEVLVY